MNERGHYGRRVANGVHRVGQVPIYVERKPSRAIWIYSAVVLGSSILWARYQSRQIEQLQKAAGIPHQSFAASLRQGAGASLRSLAERVQPSSRRPDANAVAIEAIELETIEVEPRATATKLEGPQAARRG